MEASELVALLGVWTNGKGSLQRRLTGALMRGVRQGGMAPGVRLPSERALAKALATSRTTVVAAYDELRAAGWLESRQGSGTWVRSGSTAISMARMAAQGSTLAASPLMGLLVDREDGDVIDFGLGSPLPLEPLGEDHFELPRSEYTALMRERLHYPLGLPTLRQGIADRCTRDGLPTTSEQVLITNGAQHALSLITSLFVQRGDSVLLEDPAYFGAIAALDAAGARLSSLPVAAGGVAPATVRDRMRATAARLVYLTPGCQNPTGEIMSGEARKEIARIALHSGTPIIDDRTLADLVLFGPVAPPLATSAPNGPILTVGSLAKLVGPALRIGWIRASESLIQRLGRLKATMDLGSPLVAQAVAAQLMRVAEQARLWRQRELRPKRDLVVALLRKGLPDWSFAVPRAGLFLWVTLPEGDAREFAQVALRHGVVVIPGPTMSAEGRHTRSIRITFLSNPDTLEAGVQRLGRAWMHYRSIGPSAREQVVIV